MRWSFRFLTLHGVEIHSHISFPLVLVWAAWQGTMSGGWIGAAFDVLSVTLLFACVLLHEMGHSLEAQRLGLPVRRITLFPIGGVAELGLLPEKPGQEFRIALAGPAVNLALGLALGGVAAAWIILVGHEPRQAVVAAFDSPSALGLLLYLVAANASLAAFNLIPAFPMDGGRLLRATLAKFLDVVLATRIAAIAGYVIAAGLIVVGLAGLPLWRVPANPLLALVGVFVVIGARYEEFWLRVRVTLSRIPAGLAVQPPTWTVSPGDAITPLLGLHSFQAQPALPVVAGRKVVGLLLEKDLQAALARPERLTIAHVMRADFPRVRASDNLWQAHEMLAGFGLPALPVVEDGKLAGMITRADVRRAGRTSRDLSGRPYDHAPDIRTISLGEKHNL